MVVLGLILLVLCAVVAVGIALANTSSTSFEAFTYTFSGLTLGGLFLLGMAIGALAMLGLALMVAGAKRKRARKVALKNEVHEVRNERETLAEENARLQAELEQERTAPAYPSGGASGPQGLPEDSEAPGKHRR